MILTGPVDGRDPAADTRVVSPATPIVVSVIRPPHPRHDPPARLSPGGTTRTYPPPTDRVP